MKSPHCKKCGGPLVDSIAPKSGRALRYCPICHRKARALAKSVKPDFVAAQRRAHTIVLRAVRRGLISRKPCEECGDPKSEGHHEDYSKPLDVVWLCRTHHRRRHIAEAKPSRALIHRKALK